MTRTYQKKKRAESEAETRLVAWLQAVDSFTALVGLARGSLTEDALVGLCFQFYEKGLLELGAKS